MYYSYNAANKVTRVRVCDPLRTHTTWYSYDNNGRIDTVWSKLGAVGTGLGVHAPTIPSDSIVAKPSNADIAYLYGKRGSVDTVWYMLINAKIGYRFNARGFLSSISAYRNGTGFFSETLTRSATGIISRQVSQHSGYSSRTQDYTYDGLDRLVRWKSIYGSDSIGSSYSYDIMGNRLSATGADSSSGFSYTGNQLTHSTVVNSTHVYSYNDNGDLVTRSKRYYNSGFYSIQHEQFSYNAAGTLEKYLQAEIYGSATLCLTASHVQRWIDWRYRYSPLGGREQKRQYDGKENDANGNAYEWTYYQLGAGDEQRSLWQGTQTSDADSCSHTGRRVYFAVTEYCVYGAMGLEIVTKPDATLSELKQVQFHDHLGSVRASCDSLGMRTASDFKPFGSILWSLNGSTVRSFIGNENDNESSLGDFGARKYDATIGRFISCDKLLRLYPSWTPYHYAMNSPISKADYNGLYSQIDCSTASANADRVEDESDWEVEPEAYQPGVKKRKGGGGGSTYVQSISDRQFKVEFYMRLLFAENQVTKADEKGTPGDGSGGGGSAKGGAVGNSSDASIVASQPQLKWAWSANSSKLGDKGPAFAGVSNIYTLNEIESKFYTAKFNELTNFWSNVNSGHYAPIVAKYFKDVSIPVVLVDFETTSSGEILGQTPGDRSRILISKKVADNDLAPTMLHETVHLMGYGEFGAHAAEFAAGYLSAEELWSALQSDRGQKYILQINPTKDFGGWICAKYFTNSGQFWGKKEELLRDMFNYGSQIIGTRK